MDFFWPGLALLMLVLMVLMVESAKEGRKGKISIQNLLDELTRDLALQDVKCLEYFSLSSMDSYHLNIPVINIHIDKIR